MSLVVNSDVAEQLGFDSEDKLASALLAFAGCRPAKSDTVQGSIYSLGTTCYAAALIKNAGWSRGESPFDWIFSSPEMIRHCLEDGFKQFLDATNFQPVPVCQRRTPDVNRCDHTFYKTRFGVNHVFNHIDPTGSDFAFIQKKVIHFQHCLAADKPKTLLQIISWRPDWERQFELTKATLSTQASQATLFQVVIAERSQSGLPKVEVRQQSKDGVLILFKPVSAWQALRFEDVFDDYHLIAMIRTTGFVYPLHTSLYKAS